MIRRIVRSYDVNDITKFVAKVFAKNEPMCKVLNVNEKDIENTFGHLINECCVSNLSTLWRNNSINDSIIATSLVLPYYKYKNYDIINNSETLTPIIRVLNEIGDIPDGLINNSVYYFMHGTDESFANNGYLKKGVLSTIENSEKNLYDFIIADATNVVSQHVLKKYDFKVYKKVKFNDDIEIYRMIREIYY